MAYSFTEKKRIRKDFRKQTETMEVPYLLTTQIDSYRDYLQAGIIPSKRKDAGLQAAFKSVFPMVAYNSSAALEFVKYRFDEPGFDEKECRIRGLTYAAPLKVTTRLAIFDRESKEKKVKDIREQEVYMGEMPLMTGNGTFIINGTERVIVSQLHRSPGVFLIMTVARRTALASCYIAPASFRTVGPGSTLNSTPRTTCSYVSIVAASCQPPSCCALWAMTTSRCWKPSTSRTPLRWVLMVLS